MPSALSGLATSAKLELVSRLFRGESQWWGSICLLVLCLQFLPLILLGADSYFLVHDNLDGTFVYLYNLVRGVPTPSEFGPAFENVMNGLPRSALRSDWNVTALLFRLPPHVAYIVNYIVTHTVGYFGMVILLQRHFLRSAADRSTVYLCALAFASIPFYSNLGVSISGQPFLLNSFLNILRRKDHLSDGLVIIAFPFYSGLVFAGSFVIVALSGLWIVDALKRKAGNGRYALAVLLLCALYLVIEHQLIDATFLSKPFVSHRTEFNRLSLGHGSSVADIARESGRLFWDGQYHAGAFPSVVIVFLLVFRVLVIKRIGNIQSTVWPLLAAICGISVFAGLYPLLAAGFGPKVGLLQMFRGERFYVLLPLLWTMLLFLTLSGLTKSQARRMLVFGAIGMHLWLVAGGNKEVVLNVKQLVDRPISEPNYREFFAGDLFKRIDAFIGVEKSEYRVVSIGMHPAVSQLNGFYTLDSYQNNYPLSYKHRFRRIIERELDKDNELRDYFDDWGSRCYVFSSELGMDFMVGEHLNMEIRDLELNSAELWNMGGRYVFSAAKILNSQKTGLRFIREFDDENSYWRVYLYMVMPPDDGRSEDVAMQARERRERDERVRVVAEGAT